MSSWSVLAPPGIWGEDGADHAKIAAHDSAGPDLAATRWLVEDQGVIMVGSDTSGYEVNPPPDSPGTGIPVHRYLLVNQGVHLGELHNLEGLSKSRGLYVLLYRRGQQDQGCRGWIHSPASGDSVTRDALRRITWASRGEDLCSVPARGQETCPLLRLLTPPRSNPFALEVRARGPKTRGLGANELVRAEFVV